MKHWPRRLWGLLLLLCASVAQAQDFRDPAQQSFTVWPNIAVVRAADMADYAQDRQIFSDLHQAKAEPEKIIAALKAVDSLQGHHQNRALNELGRSLNTQLIGEIDRLGRRPTNTRAPKLRFDFADITPEQLQRPQALDDLKAKADKITLAMVVTYTRLDGTLVQATATLVKLRSGASQSFSVTAPAGVLGERLGQEIFDYFQGTRFGQHRSPLGAAEWLTAAPGHAEQLVSRSSAERYCHTQQAQLPSGQELELAEAAGFHGGGVVLRSNAVYHVSDGLYDNAAALAGEDKLRPNYLAGVPNGFYYCMRPPKAVAAKAGKSKK